MCRKCPGGRQQFHFEMIVSFGIMAILRVAYIVV